MRSKWRNVHLIRTLTIIVLIVILFPIEGCHIYSFTGASIDADVKTIVIKYFPNNASLVNPSLSRMITDALRDKFQQQTTLKSVSSGGDLVLEGEITDYRSDPVAIQSDQKAGLQRLTVTINVRFTNNKHDKKNYEQSFSRYQDYDGKLRLSEVEDNLVTKITEEIVQDIFNKSVVDW
jgi:ABC-type uncharacterized transport system auxiliary subunit